MPFPTLDYFAIRANILRDIANQDASADVGDDSDYAMRANANASATEGLYQFLQWIARQILPDDADPEFLYRHAAVYGLSLIQPAAASGTIAFSGLAGSPIPQGTEAKIQGVGGVAFVTTAAGTVGAGGTVNVPAQASLAGSAGNQATGTALTLTSAPPGVQSTAQVIAMNGGADLETDVSLLARLLDIRKNPPAGGNQYDYIRWAKEVPGVARAFCYPLRRGADTTDVAIVPAGGGSASAQLLSDVFTYIENLRPVGGDVLVFSPAQVAVDVAAALVRDANTTLATATPVIQAALAAYFAPLIPGSTVYRTKLSSLISDQAGIVDLTLTAPAANVVTLVDATHLQMPVLGTVTLT